MKIQTLLTFLIVIPILFIIGIILCDIFGINFSNVYIYYTFMLSYIIVFLVYFNVPLLSKKEQIKILQSVIDNYDESGGGLCDKLDKALNTNDFISNYIPSFTLKNCVKLSEKYNFKKPEYTHLYYWWDVPDRENRLKCLNALLTELKK